MFWCFSMLFLFQIIDFTVRLENFLSFCASHSQFGSSREKNFVFLPRWAKLTVLSTKTKNSPGSLSKSIIFNRKIMEKRSTSKRNDDMKFFMPRDLQKMSEENFQIECQFLGHEGPIGPEWPKNLHERGILPTNFQVASHKIFFVSWKQLLFRYLKIWKWISHSLKWGK